MVPIDLVSGPFLPTTCCHTFRATGITAYLDNGGKIESAQAIAAHESPRTSVSLSGYSDETYALASSSVRLAGAFLCYYISEAYAPWCDPVCKWTNRLRSRSSNP